MSPAASWDDLRVFLAVERRGSHGAAARLLSVNPTTVTRRMSALEAALGVRLFDRTPAGLVLTRAGSALRERALRVEAEILAAERELGGEDARLVGPVRITAGDGLVHYAVIPALGDLARAHPGITVELRAETRTLDLSRREADVALRLSRPKEPALVVQRAGALAFGLFASRAYLERRGVPRSRKDLAGHDFIGFEAALDELPQVRWLRRTVSPIRWRVRATTTTAQAMACAEGAGIALLGTFFTSRLSGLVPVLPSLAPPERDAWVVFHEDLKGNARVRAAAEWLTRLGALRDRL